MTTRDRGAVAPNPSLSLGIGITGHRADRIIDPDRVRAQIAWVMDEVARALEATAARDPLAAGYGPVRMVSALAEGADRIAATAALDTGHPLDVVLPFTAEEYQRDFEAEASRRDFNTLLAQAGSVLVLGGAADAREKAYDALGVALLDNCDLLVAVWDGGPGRGRGGTRDVLEEAARRAIPVVVISPDGAEMGLRAADPPGPMRFVDVPVQPMGKLDVIVGRLAAAESDGSPEAEWLALTRQPRDPPISGAYPLLLRLAGVQPWWKRRVVQVDAKADAPPANALELAFGWWDRSAIHAAQAFRSAVIVNFALAALAVVLAATSILSSDLKWLFVAAELITILLLILNTISAGRCRWQDRWLAAREMAELLRVASMLRCVGIGRYLAQPAYGGRIGWYAASFSRSAGLAAVDLSDPVAASRVAVQEISGQAAWNAATAKRMHRAAHRIERFGEVLFVSVLAAAAGWLVLYLVAEDTAEALKYPLTALTAGLPAVATASYGIRIILDFEGISERAHRIASGLDVLLERWEAGSKTGVELQDFARRAAEIMLADVAAWRLLAEGRRLTIPG